MPTIEKGRTLLTLVNVFTVEPEKQQALISLLIDATEKKAAAAMAQFDPILCEVSEAISVG